MVSTCPLVQDPCYQCVTRCGQTTCTVCPVACMTCKIPGHKEDMQSCVIPKGREANFVCEMHDTAAMYTRIQVIIDARELSPRQLKEKRARSKQSLIDKAGDSGRESHAASHVAISAIVDETGLAVRKLRHGPEMQMLLSRPRWTPVRLPGLPGLPAPFFRTACTTVIALYRSPPLFQLLAGLAPSKRPGWQLSAPFTEHFGQCSSRSKPQLSARACATICGRMGCERGAQVLTLRCTVQRTLNRLALVLSFALLGCRLRMYRKLSSRRK